MIDGDDKVTQVWDSEPEQECFRDINHVNMGRSSDSGEVCIEECIEQKDSEHKRKHVEETSDQEPETLMWSKRNRKPVVRFYDTAMVFIEELQKRKEDVSTNEKNEWNNAQKEKLNSVFLNNTCVEVDLPPESGAIPGKMIYKTKLN